VTTIFGHPVELTMAMPGGQVLALSHAIEITGDGIKVDPGKVALAISVHHEVARQVDTR
jgi:hypothetical protein